MAEEVFRRMEVPDVVGYTSLVSALHRSRELERAVEVRLGLVVTQGLLPNEHTMTSR